MFIPYQEKYKLNEGNVITIGLDTQTVFYQPHDFYTGQNIQVFSIKESFNKEIALFLIPLIKSQLSTLSWGGNGATLGRLKKKKILLPATATGNINFDYIENKVDNLSKEVNKMVRPTSKNDIYDFRSLSDVIWGGFPLNEICIVKSGKDWKQKTRTSGKGAFVDYSGKIQVGKNVISVNRNGSYVGMAFYHPYEAYFSGDTRFLKLKNHSGNFWINEFISVMIMQQRKKYQFGYKMGTSRIKRQIIQLPIKEDGTPDYEFMEQFMKRMENKVIS
ncbi:hypothetical protein B4077_0937 [Bacillus cereus]|uniref:Type I restriction modification DNA specificity domain-containing protein n=2 Tax=Bacillus cereus TaxID=1396 RepID=A0A0G8F6S7_BACCE|nr:hypothetical protein B4077_0937 [Bacillus cereus]